MVNVSQPLLPCQLWTTAQSLALLTAANSDFVQQALLPHLQASNGVNARSVVVLDNASIHHVDGVVDLTESTGGLPPPPYSLDLNAIEEAFSKTLKVYEALLDILEEKA